MVWKCVIGNIVWQLTSSKDSFLDVNFLPLATVVHTHKDVTKLALFNLPQQKLKPTSIKTISGLRDTLLHLKLTSTHGIHLPAFHRRFWYPFPNWASRWKTTTFIIIVIQKLPTWCFKCTSLISCTRVFNIVCRGQLIRIVSKGQWIEHTWHMTSFGSLLSGVQFITTWLLFLTPVDYNWPVTSAGA